MATIKFEVSGNARPRRIFLDNEEITLDAQGKGETNREPGPAKVSFMAFGDTGAALKIKMQNIDPAEINESVQAEESMIIGFTKVEVKNVNVRG